MEAKGSGQRKLSQSLKFHSMSQEDERGFTNSSELSIVQQYELGLILSDHFLSFLHFLRFNV